MVFNVILIIKTGGKKATFEGKLQEINGTEKNLNANMMKCEQCAGTKKYDKSIKGTELVQ